MAASIIDGRVVSREIREELRQRVEALKAKGVTPGLAFVLVGENPASISYVASKNQGAAEVGINSHTFQIPADTAQERVIELVQSLNRDPAWNGILVQLPLPRPISEDAVINAIDPAKDVDGIHPANIGRLLRGEPTFKPATPAGVQQLLLRSGNDPAGKHVVICGRSNIVGKPLAAI
ncbi:MAG TPA: tetrahydrofolate dehydrogenase/cyclohydrolase catalytic domain-containing protein, partial [Dehalococcoidia bacterium]|nr:tetrahydrofolate dehydrogenase/cyclohydrolase catalytic domain-containing protein [Dehalococcoidia bacterium]